MPVPPSSHESEVLPTAPFGADNSPAPAPVPAPVARRWATLRSAVREFAIIVAGVLVALGAQAWWEHSQELEREGEYLEQLLVDTRENERRLGRAVSEDSASAVALAAVVDALTGSGPAPPADSLHGAIAQAGSRADFKPVTGTYGALLSTGDLRLIRNDSLRSALVNYASWMSSELDRQEQLRGQVIGAAPAIARTLPWMRRAFLGPVRPSDAELTALRGDGEAVALFFTLQASNVNSLNGLRRLREQTRSLRETLEGEVHGESGGSQR